MSGPGDHPDRIVIARLRRPWGRRGELLVELHTDWPHERFAPGRRVRIAWDDGRETEREVRSYRELPQGALLGIAGVDDIGAAQDLAGGWIVAGPGELERPPGADLLQRDLVGLAVRTTEGEPVGTVAGIEEGTQADLLRVARPGGEDVLVPLAPAICRDVDLAAGVITIAALPGLLDLDEAEETPPEMRTSRTAAKAGR